MTYFDYITFLEQEIERSKNSFNNSKDREVKRVYLGIWRTYESMYKKYVDNRVNTDIR